MRSDVDDLAEETFFALEEEAAIVPPQGGRWGQVVDLVLAHGALNDALNRTLRGLNARQQIALALTHLRQAVNHQPGLSGSASRALDAIRGGDLRGALAIVRGMYRLVGGGTA